LNPGPLACGQLWEIAALVRPAAGQDRRDAGGRETPRHLCGILRFYAFFTAD
jgi:hypothetical protein